MKTWMIWRQVHVSKGGLKRRSVKEKFQTFLTNMKFPQNEGYRLQQDNGTYKYRCQLLKNFIDKKKSEGLQAHVSEQFRYMYINKKYMPIRGKQITQFQLSDVLAQNWNIIIQNKKIPHGLNCRFIKYKNIISMTYKS